MRTSRFTVSQIAAILRSAEERGGVAKVATAHGISPAMVYQWRAKYGRVSEDEMQLSRDMRQENTRLKHMYAELSRDHLIVTEVLATMLSPIQRRKAVTWAVDVKHLSQRNACRLLAQHRGTQRRSLRNPEQPVEQRPVVLVVEDHPDAKASIGNMVDSWADVDLLMGNGFLEAATWINAASRIDLLICAANLTGEMTGIDVAEIAVKTFPNITVVIVSGHEQLEIPRFTERYTYLRKPFDREQLLDHIDGASPELKSHRRVLGVPAEA
jgi:putative transposase